MSFSSATTPTVVLQGEFAVVDHAISKSPLKSPVPTTCTVLTLFNQERQISVMAHIDDYTSVQGVFNQIEMILRNRHHTSLTALDFEAKVMGGTGDLFSQEQQKAVTSALESIGIEWTKVDLGSERPQIKLDTSTGELVFCRDINRTLEYMQLREYGDFNTLIDLDYGQTKGEDIPFFEPKEATRKETQFSVLNQAETVAVSSKDGVSKSNWVHFAQMLEVQGVFKVDKRPKRAEVPSQRSVIEQVNSLVLGRFNKFAPLKHALESKNFALMLRQTAADKRVYELFALLFKNATALSIPLTAKGTTSGTVWDVAEGKDNTKAIQLLSQES